MAIKMKVNTQDILTKWFPYSVYMFYLIFVVNAFCSIVFIYNKCVVLVGGHPFPKVNWFAIIASGLLIWPFFVSSMRNNKDSFFYGLFRRYGRIRFYTYFIEMFYCALSIIIPLCAAETYEDRSNDRIIIWKLFER